MPKEVKPKQRKIREMQVTKINDRELVLVEDVAKAFSCSTRTIKRYLNSKKLKGIHFAGKWFVLLESIENFIEEQLEES